MQVIYTILCADMVIYILMYLDESISRKESHIEFVEQNLGANLGSIVVEKSGCCVRKYVCFLWGRFSNDVLLFPFLYEIRKTNIEKVTSFLFFCPPREIYFKH